MAVREALVIGTSAYEDTRLNQLRSPGLDAMELSEVLGDPGIGGYEVRPVIDQPAHVVQREIERFFRARRPDDQLLLYLSCHGIKDSRLQLYFAAADTDRDLLDSTSVPAVFVNSQLARCASRKILVLLDCCYSGAFRPGGAKAADTAVHLLEEFKDTGVAVITATDALQQAWEGDGPATETGEGQLSVFTAAAVEGLRSGRADRDGDGWVSVEDLYGHVRAEMLARDARQNPLRWILGGQGTLKIARRAAPAGTGPLPLPRSLPAVGGLATTLLAGITPGASVLRRTLGPIPRPVLVTGEDGTPHASTDTLEIVAALPTEPGHAALGTGLLRELVADQYRRAMDGTATAAVVFESVVRGLQPALARGTHPAVLARSVPLAFARARGVLSGFGMPLEREWSRRLTDAVTAVCQDEEIGIIVGSTVLWTGEEGAVTVTDSAGFGLDRRFSEGCSMAAGYLSPAFTTDAEHGEAVLHEAKVLICAGPLTRVQDVLPALELVVQAGRPVLVVAPKVDGEVLSTLAVNAEKKTLASIAVALPSDLLPDLGCFTGAKVFGKASDIRDAKPEHLGQARQVVSTRRRTVLIDGGGRVGTVNRLVDQLVGGEDRRPPTAAELSAIKPRLALLRTKVGEIAVGGATDDAIRQRTALVRRAVHTGQAALRSGLVPGGAAALAVTGHRPDAVGDPATRDVSEALGKALAEPLLALATNRGETEPETVLRRIQAEWPTVTYEATRGTFHACGTAGVWEPATTGWEMLRAVEAAVIEYLTLI
ncbi:TCP-1/cpn60 chaperonin family protein [Streptomyces sp. NPDC057705]|uniref:caspase, EACC1-associated type n=1 Tax=Streptomyces sp. NPDC057705 TaxID=3346222 RepID=UPI0036A6917A